jgi:E3 ubiquitin-protein ligase HUWE1
LFNAHYGLFQPTGKGRSYVPNRLSSIANQDALAYFEFAGQVIARALVENCLVDAHLTPAILKHLLNVPTGKKDVQDFNPEIYQSFLFILDPENDPEELGIYFVFEYDEFGKTISVELTPNGRNVPLTRANKEEYVRSYSDQLLKVAIAEQTERFKQGFYAVIPLEEIRMFRPDELDLVICGVPEISAEDFIAACDWKRPYSATHPVIQMFINVVKNFTTTQRAQLLWFITGSSQMPIGGFRALASRSPLEITQGLNPDLLPESHTCFHQLVLPAYPNEEVTRTKLLCAMKWGDTFGMS